MIRVSISQRSTKKTKGFALVLALALLSLVFLLVISLVNLVSTDLSVVDARKERILAQAHARMGMKIALGEIQKHLGPDMRISATADLLDERIESAQNYEEETFPRIPSTTKGIDLNENGTIDSLPFGQRNWTGVWKHRGRDRGVDENKLGAKPLPENIDTGDSLSEYPMVSTEFDPHPAIEVSWLVSGNEGFSKKLYFGNNPNQLLEFVEIPDGNIWDTDQPDNGRSFVRGGVYGSRENAWEDYASALDDSPLKGSEILPEYNHPLFELPDPITSEDTTWLLVAPLLDADYDNTDFDLSDSSTWENSLRAEPVKVRKTRIQTETEGSDESEFGAYAYWVGDEGVKSKINIQNPNKDSSNEQIKKDNLTVATEPNLPYSHGEGSGSNTLKSGLGFGWQDPTTEAKKKDIHSLGLLSDLISEDKDTEAFFHSVTTDSFGVLSDVRTGGLKRDLSSAFANEDDWGNLENVSDAWKDDFSNYIYKQRIFYQKSVPLGFNAKENDWRTGSDQTLLEEHGILAGPRWSVMGSFHNLYLSSTYSDLTPNNFPRVVGDNNVLFNHLLPSGVKPNSPGNSSAISSSTRLRQNFNYFRGLEKRPEPTNHSLQPVLLEIKYSHHPIFQQGQLGLAAYPSVAFWNPYNKPITLQDIYIEIPMSIGIHAMNARHYDLYRKWWLYCYDPELFATQNPGTDPTEPTFQIPPGFKNFEDRNGNGRRDPGEPLIDGNVNSGNPVARPMPRENFFRYLNFSSGHPYPRSTVKMPLTYGGFVGNLLGNVINSNFTHSLDHGSTAAPSSGDRHLLLRIGELELEPGEKAHFTVNSTTTITPGQLPTVGQTDYIKVDLNKLTSGEEDTPVVFLSGDATISGSEPVSVRYWSWGFRGVHPNDKEAFDANGQRIQNSTLKAPKGITVYFEDPDGTSLDSRKVLAKINKQFPLDLGSGITDFVSCDELILPSGSNLPGCGFRIRFKLPAKTESVVFEQFNIRALVNSNQDGFGDNWEFDSFNSNNAYGNTSTLFIGQGENSFTVGANPYELSERYPNFVSLPSVDDDNVLGVANFPLLPIDSSLVGVDSNYGVMLKASAFNTSVGYFHDDDTVGSMEGEARAIMFEIPESPLLSIFQFRHANLNNYSHGPSYSFGNSYASPQVARYKTWGKMKAFALKPNFPGMDIPRNITLGQQLQNAGLGYNPFIWLPNREINYDDPIRDQYVNQDHQNVTLDHSFYLNYALCDGYFTSGLGIGSEWSLKDLNEFEPGDRYLPLRNPRLIPYLRNSQWKLTSYSEKRTDLASSGTDDQYRYQTLSSDLLVDGQFNVNSTSVDAWASQLASLRGQEIEGASVSNNETPIPRFLEYVEDDSWNNLRKLSDQEINLLAHKIVEQVKLRGPFLSYSDFVNRRIQGNKVNLLGFPFSQWNTDEREETRSSSIGLRGAVQAGIAEAKLNQGSFSSSDSEPLIPTLPSERFSSVAIVNEPWPLPSALNLHSSQFGIHAISSGLKTFQDHNPDGNVVQYSDYLSYPPIARPNYDPDNVVNSNPYSFFVYPQKWGKGYYTVEYENPAPPSKKITMPDGTLDSFKYNFQNYEDTFYYGEAPENLLAVENVATGANKPGWLMQSDLLSPLVPVTSVRSDTFTVRVMGENKKKANNPTQSKAWIELTVQRVPDYIKPDLDNPHHRPHEPFEDRNFNGYWDAEINEHWIDLNQDSVDRQRDGTTSQKQNDIYPNLPSDNPSFADGLESDLSINHDPDEEDVSSMNATVSRLGINQRFGRKFKIIKFRWLKAQDV